MATFDTRTLKIEPSAKNQDSFFQRLYFRNTVGEIMENQLKESNRDT